MAVATIAALLGWSAGPAAAGFGDSVEYAAEWGGGTGGEAPGELDYPTGLAVMPNGELVVADFWNHRIQVFSAGGTYLRHWGEFGSGAGLFDRPTDVAIDARGNIYVTELGDRVQKFAADGTYLTEWGTLGSGDAQLRNPWAVDIGPDGTVYVADTGNDRVQMFTQGGTHVGQWGSTGPGDGKFEAPAGLAVSHLGNVFVGDRNGAGLNDYRVQVFTADGAFIAKWGERGSGAGQFESVPRIALDGSGNVYVADTGNDRVQMLTAAGAPLAIWGSTGADPGEFRTPTGVAVSSAGSVYVADGITNRVLRFRIRTSTSFPAGIGTATPGRELEIADRKGTPMIRLRDTGPSKAAYDIGVAGDQLQVIDAIARTVPLKVRPGAATNTLVIGTGGRVGINRAFPTQALHVAGNIVASGSITPGSDEATKTAFATVDPAGVLEKLAGLEIRSWSYRHDPPTVRHLGPTAQDFAAAFGLGDGTATGISTVDADGVALAAIQALTTRVAELEAELAALRKALDGG